MLFILSVLLAAAAFAVWRTASRRAAGAPQAAKQLGGLAGIGAVVFTILAIAQLFVVIRAGHVGVVDFFGTVSERALPAGINIVNPLAKVKQFSIQTQEIKETMQVLSREGLTIGLEISTLYRLNPDSASRVYQTILGGDYETVILTPQFRSISRSVTASFQASALYSSDRERLGVSIQNELAAAVAPRGVIVEATPLRNVALPAQLTEAIEQKQRAEQESQRMEFILAKERQEAERKRIEGKGISDFQTIVSQGISDQLLRWKGVEATEKLAQSTNTKIIIVGAGKDGLPVILDTK